jgi:hypothetical protein
MVGFVAHGKLAVNWAYWFAVPPMGVATIVTVPVNECTVVPATGVTNGVNSKSYFTPSSLKLIIEKSVTSANDWNPARSRTQVAADDPVLSYDAQNVSIVAPVVLLAEGVNCACDNWHLYSTGVPGVALDFTRVRDTSFRTNGADEMATIFS